MVTSVLGTKEWHISREMPREPLDSCWTQCPSPQEDELFLSWFTRTAKANCADPSTLYAHLAGNNASPDVLFARIEMARKHKAMLIARLKPFVGNIADLLKFLPNFKVSGEFCARNWNFLNHPREFPRFCPSCLKTDKNPYIRHHWHLPFVTACPTHRVLLRDCCPHCYSPLAYWNSAWNAPMTTCPHCLKEITDEEMFVKNLQSHEIIQFQQDLQEIYKTETLKERPVEVHEFFQHLWRIAACACVDPCVGEYSDGAALSTERVCKALGAASRAIQADVNLIQPPFLEVTQGCIVTRRHQEHLRPRTFHDTCIQTEYDLKNLRESGEYTRKEWEIAEFRYNTIKPLLAMVQRTALDVTNFARKRDISQKTAYNWMARYKQSGIKALIPQNKKSGCRPRTYPPEIEALCTAYIHRHLSSQPANPEPIRKFWIIFNDECLRKGWLTFQIPKIGTFYKRYKLILTNIERQNRKSSDSSEINAK